LNGSLNGGTNALLGQRNNSSQLVDEANAPMLGEINFISGTIRGEEQDRLRKLVFRATRGKALTFFQDFLQNGVSKVVYMVVFQDIQGTADRV
jgi:hypothetical protein